MFRPPIFTQIFHTNISSRSNSLMIISTYGQERGQDATLPHARAYFEPVSVSMRSSDCDFLVVMNLIWFSKLFHAFPELLMLNAVKAFPLDNGTHVMCFRHSRDFSMFHPIGRNVWNQLEQQTILFWHLFGAVLNNLKENFGLTIYNTNRFGFINLIGIYFVVPYTRILNSVIF